MHIDPLALARFRDAETHQLTTYDLDKMKKVPVYRGQKGVLGYAESYTLFAAAAAYYAWTRLRFVQGRASLLWPTLGLGLAVALHLMALSLVLSWLYLLWRDQGNLGVWIRNP